MKVKLIGITKPVHESAEMFVSKDIISYCARVSNPANQENFATADRLLAYCAKNEHWSPFEMVNVVMEIETTRDIARQILRHRSFSFQEFSQRYAEVDVDNWVAREARLQDTKNRQNSIEINDNELNENWEASQREVWLTAIDEYKWALSHGIAKEVARAILPEGLTMSRMYMNGTLRSWIHYCQLRMENGTQKEHREVAAECWKIITNEFKFLNDIYGEKNAAN
jgi:thymidylate synthase (FAD)